MITLTESIHIDAPFEALCAWGDNFEREFVRWSPYHLECQLLAGGIGKGDRVRFYEIVMGRDYDVTGTIVESEQDTDRFRFTFRSDAGTARITFEGRRTAKGCFFTHTESFGLGAPVIGPIINFILFRVLYRKKADWELIRADMALDNRYLAEILTSGTHPARIAPERLKHMPPGRPSSAPGKRR